MGGGLNRENGLIKKSFRKRGGLLQRERERALIKGGGVGGLNRAFTVATIYYQFHYFLLFPFDYLALIARFCLTG